MDTVLIVLTCASIAAAAAFGFSAWRSRADEARRSATRDEPALELVSMRHAREGRTLTVTGLVRNPRVGVPRSNIAAVVFVFDRSGGFVASGRAALDFTNLAPGDESPFVVKIPDVAGVVRYRVSFRTEAGILRHLDRRGGQPPASPQRKPS